ncbi:MAG: hypothetical protein AAF745_09150 [Planctomycetota bacterium]
MPAFTSHPITSNRGVNLVMNKMDRDFYVADTRLKHAFRQSIEKRQVLSDFARKTGVDDPKWHQSLIDFGLDASSWQAVVCLPLAFVSWASGEVTQAESERVFATLHDVGLDTDSETASKLSHWLNQPPTDGSWQLWRDSMMVLKETMNEQQWRSLSDWLLRASRAVAEASGGVLGLGRICAAEQAVIDRLQFDLRVMTRSA